MLVNLEILATGFDSEIFESAVFQGVEFKNFSSRLFTYKYLKFDQIGKWHNVHGG